MSFSLLSWLSSSLRTTGWETLKPQAKASHLLLPGIIASHPSILTHPSSRPSYASRAERHGQEGQTSTVSWGNCATKSVTYPNRVKGKMQMHTKRRRQKMKKEKRKRKECKKEYRKKNQKHQSTCRYAMLAALLIISALYPQSEGR
ncbi:hypothetical protein K440DRAFT_149503 [Wilcoxina mikolae CBS 423.85]|nr:hypothetical protein K440DRAFT_149503 [Wilcoxina mikolae CBS 423.85]